MKKKILVLVMLVLCLFGLAACEEVVAPQGDKGDQGNPGKSAYEVAVENGFVGDIDAWLESLKGAQGQTGKTGATGQNGQNGQNANEIEVFVEDGGLYWHYVDKDGNAVGEDQLLYFYQDYITLTYSKKEFDQVEDLVATFLADVSAAYGSEVTAENFADTFDSNGKFMGDDNGKPSGLMADNPSLFNKYKFMIQWVYDNLYARPSSDQFFSNDTSHKYELATLEAFGIDTSWSNASSSRSHNINHGNKNIVANVANFLNGNNEATGTSDYYPAGSFEGVDRSGVVAGGVALLPPVVIKRADLATYELVTFEKNDPIMGDGYAFVKWVDAEGNEVKNGELKNHSQELFIVTQFEGIFVTLLVDDKDAGVGFEAEPLTNVNKNDVVSPSHEGYVFLGWVDAEGNAVKPGAMRDGGTYQATWRKNNIINLNGGWSVNGLAKDFCADLSVIAEKEITPENFYETFKSGGFIECGFVDETLVEDSATGELKFNGGLIANETLLAKWGWYLGFIASKVTNKYAATAFALAGFNPNTESRVTTYPSEACHLVVGTISNALNATALARNEYNPCAGFASQDAYEGLDVLVYEQIKAGTIAMSENMTASLEYSGNENFAFFCEGKEFGGYSADGADPVKFSEIQQGLTYDVYWAVKVEIDYNGGYVYSKDAIIADFLADVSTAKGSKITAENFYTTFNDEAAQFMGVTGTDEESKFITTGLMADHPELLAKWGWVIEFIAQKQSDRYWNTPVVAFGLHSAEDAKVASGDWKYCNRYLIGCIHNFLNASDENKPGSSSHACIKFGSESAYDGLAELAAQNGALETSRFAFAKDVPALVAELQYAHHKLLGFYDAADAEQKLVAYEDMKLAGHKYMAKWEAAVQINLDGGYAVSKQAVIDAFLADVSVAAGKEITAANFYSTYNSETAPFMGVGTQAEGVYPTFGLCAEHPELITKWGWLIEWIGQKKADSYWDAALIAYGLTPKAGGDTPKTSPGKYGNRYMIACIDNFLNAGDNQVGASSHTAVAFTSADAYDGVVELALTNKCVPESAILTGTIDVYLSDNYVPVIGKEGYTFAGFSSELTEGASVKATYNANVTYANELLLTGWSSGADYIHANHNWTVDQYKAVDGVYGWYETNSVMMRCRAASDSTHVVNFAGGWSTPNRYTYNLNGASLGVANTLTLKVGNYYTPNTTFNIKVSIIDMNGNTIFLLGDANNWFTMPVTGGETPLIAQTLTFDAVEVQSVRVTINSSYQGSQFLYVADDALLSYVEE